MCFRVVVEARSPVLDGVSNRGSGAQRLTLARILFLALGGIALLYALLAGLRTVTDPDFGWQMATGRWIVQHHHIPSTDVFSYTATGSPWIYPVASELLFYGIYLLGGFALLSWMGALTCVGTVALLLRRGSAFTAAVAILGIPLIADRTVPRAEMFTVLLFAAFLSLLWENYETGRAPLFWLPMLMTLWVNLHLGFIAGFALIAGFVGLDVLELFFGKARRTAALGRLKHALPWYALTGVATLVNPWGWNLFQALVRQNRAMAGQEKIIAEWAGMHFNFHGWHSFFGSFSLQPIQYTLAVMLVVVAITALASLLQLQPGAAILLGGAMYASIRYVRMEALTACVVIVIGGAMLTRAGMRIGGWIPFKGLRAALAIAACLVFVAIAAVRMREYQSDYVYLAGNARSDFGAGLSWWFPKDAADFVNREKLPANVFNSFNEGGYIVWALGENYHDYMDGRSVPFGMEGFARERELLGSPIDSPRWQLEADKYNLNTILIQLDSEEVGYDQLQDLCYANNWKPVYLDEISMVLVRNTPQNQELLKRLQINCPAATIPSTALARNSRTFQRWLNSAYVLLALRRTNEALAAANAALSINPNSTSVHWVRGDILYATSRRGEAEREWLTTLAMSRGTNEAKIWSKLGQLYVEQQRTKDAIYAWLQTLGTATDPLLKTQAYVQLSRLYVGTGNLKPALQMLDDAVKTAPQGMPGIQGGSFAFDVAQDRAAIWFRLGDVPKAISFQEEAVRLVPEDAGAWAHLALLYQKAGRSEDQQRAEARVKALTAKSK